MGRNHGRHEWEATLMWFLTRYLIECEVIALDDLNWIMPLARLAVGLIYADQVAPDWAVNL